MRCTSIIDNSHLYDYRKKLFKGRIPGAQGWGYKSNSKRVKDGLFDMVDDSELQNKMTLVDDLTGMHVGKEPAHHLNHFRVDHDVGEWMISPLKGRCFSQMVDIWEYKYCFGNKVE